MRKWDEKGEDARKSATEVEESTQRVNRRGERNEHDPNRIQSSKQKRFPTHKRSDFPLQKAETKMILNRD